MTLRFPHRSAPIWWCKSNVFHWCFLSAISLILCSATAAADLLGRNSSVLTFSVLSSWVLLVVNFEHGYISLYLHALYLHALSHRVIPLDTAAESGLSKTLFPVRILINLIVLSLPIKIFSIILIFLFPRFFSSPMFTSLILIFTGFYLWLRLCFLRAVKYSWTHLFQAASLLLFTDLCRFFQLLLTSSSFGESSGNLISLPRIIESGVNKSNLPQYC